MLKRTTTLLSLLIAAALIAAGCGGGDDETTGNATTGQATTAVEPAPPPTPEEAVDACVEGVERYQVSDARKEELRDICRALGSGDEDRVRDAAEDVCGNLIPDDAPDRESLLEKCVDGAGFKEAR